MLTPFAAYAVVLTGALVSWMTVHVAQPVTVPNGCTLETYLYPASDENGNPVMLPASFKVVYCNGVVTL